jgi:hypothetical protein
MFKDGRTNVYGEEQSGRPSVVSDLVQIVDEKNYERRRFTISELPQISRTLLYEIITVRLGYHKFYTRWVPEMLTGAYET